MLSESSLHMKRSAAIKKLPKMQLIKAKVTKYPYGQSSPNTALYAWDIKKWDMINIELYKPSIVKQTESLMTYPAKTPSP